MVEAAREKGLDGPELDAVSEAAATFQERWRCPCAGHRPRASADDLPDSSVAPLRSIAETAARVMRLSETPATCPYSLLYSTGSDFVRRTTEAAALIDEGAPPELIYPDGPFAVDREALLILRAARMARDRSEAAISEERRRKPERQ